MAPRTEGRRGSLFWTSTASPSFSVTHVLPVCSFGKWKWEKPEDNATISHQLHSPLWILLRVPVIAGRSDRHRTRRSRHAPPSSCYHSTQRRGRTAPGGGRLLGGHGGPASGEREEGDDILTYHVSIPSSNHPPSLHGNGSGGAVQNKTDNTL